MERPKRGMAFWLRGDVLFDCRIQILRSTQNDKVRQYLLSATKWNEESLVSEPIDVSCIYFSLRKKDYSVVPPSE